MTQMPAKEAAKVLREHNAWRRGEVTNPMPYNAKVSGAGTASAGLPGYTAGDNTE